MGAWVISPAADLGGFVLPLAFAFGIARLTRSLPGDVVPFHWWMLMGVSIDVAHVYGTLFRTLLDSEAFAQNWALYVLAGPGCLLASMLVNMLLGTHMGWSFLAYYAMYHFAKQPFGILCLYKARAGERGSADHQWDYWTCMAGAALPMLREHASSPEHHLRWFDAGEDFLFRLPTRLRGPLLALNVLVPLLWLSRLLKQCLVDGRPLNKGRLWIMAMQYTIWLVAVESDHQLVALAFHNVCHGIASMVLVHHVTRRRLLAWRKQRPQTMCWTDHLNEAAISSPLNYVGLMVVLAMIEEFCWEFFVNQEHLPNYGYRLPDFTERQRAAATSFLMLPQLSHYFLDGFIWKLNLKNPGLREALLTVEQPTCSGGHGKQS